MYKSNKYVSLAALASAALPTLKITKTSMPQTQSDEFLTTGIVDDKNNNYVITAPKTKNAAVILDRHCSILLDLKKIRENNNFPLETLVPIAAYKINNLGNAYIFKNISGKPLNEKELFFSSKYASSIAKALNSIHILDKNIALNNSLPCYDVPEIQKRLLADLDEGMQTRKLPQQLFSRWENQIEDVSLWRMKPCVIHANLSADAFYANNYKITGIVDFNNLHIGDPAQDFAWAFGVCGNDVLDRIFKIYNKLNPQPDIETFIKRAKLHSELMLLKWLLHGTHTNNIDIVNDAEQMLHDLMSSIDQEMEIEKQKHEKLMQAEEQARHLRAEIERKNQERLQQLQLDNSKIDEKIVSLKQSNAESETNTINFYDSLYKKDSKETENKQDLKLSQALTGDENEIESNQKLQKDSSNISNSDEEPTAVINIDTQKSSETVENNDMDNEKESENREENMPNNNISDENPK